MEKIIEARVLKNILESKSNFSDWIKRHIKANNLIEGEDFLVKKELWDKQIPVFRMDTRMPCNANNEKAKLLQHSLAFNFLNISDAKTIPGGEGQ